MPTYPTLIKPPPPSAHKSPIEDVLELTHLADINPNLFTNTRPLWHPPGARGIYGGAAIAQCLAAAQRTVPPAFLVHSMHCYFVLNGDAEIPIIYHVERVREGRSFATRTVQARQRGQPIFTTTISFMREGSGGVRTVEHAAIMPLGIAAPVGEAADDDDAGFRGEQSPFVSQRVEIGNSGSPHAHEKRTRQWIKAKGRISEEGGHQAHLSAMAYMSDSYFIGTVARVHRLWRYSASSLSPTNKKNEVEGGGKGNRGGGGITPEVIKKLKAMDEATLKRMEGMDADVIEQLKSVEVGADGEVVFTEGERAEIGMMVSLDHTIYFHSPKAFRADEWLFSECDSPWSGDGRGLKDPSRKYRRFKPLDIPNRQWPSKTIDKVPRWLATDLRDGNQSLVDPMDGEQKFRYFQMLVKLGYKEIEISYPSSGPTDFDFTRRLVTTPGVVPDDVWLQVLSPCRKELIRRTVESLKGSKKAILHLYLATSPCFQQIVFGMDNRQSKELAVECTKYARSITKDDPNSGVEEWAYEFSPETFSDSDPEFVIEICEAVKAAWEPSVENPLIFNLPATVEMSTPNVYADQIEYFCRNISERDKISVSLHPHNDRGCAVAAAELAQMAGADRVEGTLFGNGERTGNVDLVTLALNLYTQGIHPQIDFSDLNSVIDIVEKSNKIPVHPRQPYGGQLVVCAFSGSHQDAIKKGFVARDKSGATSEDPWVMPYLPLDPEDIGRTYEAIIRVNSQSGKGGVAWIIKRTLELDLPRGLQIAFSKIVQRETDMLGRELLPKEIKELFVEAYHLNRNPRFGLVDYNISTDRSTSPAPPAAQPAAAADGESGGQQAGKKTQSSRNLRRKFAGVIEIDGQEHHVSGTGNGALSALANALKNLGIDLDIADYKEHSIERRVGGVGDNGEEKKGRDTQAATFIECTAAGQAQKVWGVGIHEDVVQSSLFALLSAASSFLSSRPSTPVPFRPKRSDTVDLDVDGPGLSPLRRELNGAPQSHGPDAVASLEAKVAEGEQSSQVHHDGGAANGSAS
ncbi:hypothetical protein LTR36_003562 [Oleoguttula mirabilis]|uniref:2-isopropylmalate synthase n=1 Tax=Oleoguttula mirabilis TaxID=1507867 RepID=A0AAV9JLL9_9PEZI|nr:hypothetical protein LTR36_003562 [Oleoguttula mirabilis]